MSSKQVLIVAVLAVVFAWSTVMTVLGQLTAVATLLPSLGLLMQQIVAALNGTQTGHDSATAPCPAAEVSAAQQEEAPR
ncbi:MULTISPECIES: hypothetical protein [unclassified Streptomyces]|uniref:hypothetical protein n=1 Tax=unclassified Streptomyces TaxID=2593676 RepID=UPI002254FF51|nr:MULTISPECIES: hypothetical protein [unclassified Streptomyces]MCX4554340.1 hypothetical protein [Streptomyces sp. NBC_01500]WSC25047.1 hypothetical protein OIE60_35985 [Streptomyces sp. NBC_01766]